MKPNNNIDLNEPNHPLLKALYLEKPNSFKKITDLSKEKLKIYRKCTSYKKKLKETDQKKWLSKHGLFQNSFSDKEIQELKKYFTSLDDDGSGEIDIIELENPLISLGIAKNREDVIKIVENVTEEGEREINFTDFLSIINSKTDNQNSVLVDFFKDMIGGNLAEGSIPKNLSFELIIDTVRRKKIMDALMSTNIEKKNAGKFVLEAFERKKEFFKKFKN